MSGKLKLAIARGATCSGCDVEIVDINERILEVMEKADIVYAAVIMDTKLSDVEGWEDGAIDITFHHGAIRDSENEHIARLFRKKSKVLISFGSCSCYGGIPGLANVADRDALFSIAYRDTASTDNPAFFTPQPEWTDPQGHVLPQLGGEIVPRAAFRSRLLIGGFFPCNAVLVRTEVVRQVGLFDPELTSVEDRDLWLRIAAEYEMQGIPEPLARYRVYPGSMSTNVERMLANRVRIVSKHLGSPAGDPATWPEEKRRAYGFVYRSAAFQYVQQNQPDDGWSILAKAISIWPQILERLATYYELACGNQPRGYRGDARLLDLSAAGTDGLASGRGHLDISTGQNRGKCVKFWRRSPPRVRQSQKSQIQNQKSDVPTSTV